MRCMHAAEEGDFMPSKKRTEEWVLRLDKTEAARDVSDFRVLDKWIEKSSAVSDESLRRRI